MKVKSEKVVKQRKNSRPLKWTWSGARFVREKAGQTRYENQKPAQRNKRARFYSAQLGRFISRDPIGFVDGMSLYRAYFVPNHVDPDGLYTFSHRVTQAPTVTGTCGGAKAITEFLVRAPRIPGVIDWVVQAGLDGWVVQYVTATFDTTTCDGQEIYKATFTWKEAWKVRNGVVFIGELEDASGEDIFEIKDQGPATKGSISITGSARFLPGYVLTYGPWVKPGHPDHVPSALDLPTVFPATPPNNWGRKGNISKTLKSSWNCCICDPDAFQTDLSGSTGWDDISIGPLDE